MLILLGSLAGGRKFRVGLLLCMHYGPCRSIVGMHLVRSSPTDYCSMTLCISRGWQVLDAEAIVIEPLHHLEVP